MKNIFFAVYDEQDFLVTICDNYEELRIFFEKDSTYVLRNAVSRDTKVRYKDKWYKIYKMK